MLPQRERARERGGNRVCVEGRGLERKSERKGETERKERGKE